jgi:uncharacterized iron-regulated membrane protein
MRGKWFSRSRQAHTFLGVFFSPLLLLFIVTGWWQTFQNQDDPKTDFFDATMAKFSNIHTDDYFEKAGGHPHSSTHFKFLVAGMAVAMILTILMGLALACQNRKRSGWAVLAFALGILVPVLILALN